MQARKRALVPDASYDFDGDGVVSSLDFFVGRSFDNDMDGRLTAGERRRAENALEAGWLNGYARGFDSQGAKQRPYALTQRCGSILTLDNTADVSTSIYPQHPDSHNVPKHATKTAMELSRVGELKQAGFEVGEKFMSKMAPVPRPEPPNAQTHPRTCPVTNMSQVAEADHQASRVRAGLLPMNTGVNPERELKTNGTSYVEDPLFKTRSQLLETRKELMKQQCEDLRNKGEDAMTPRSVRSSRAKAQEYAFRQGHEESMTLTKLKDQRRVERREYDQKHFKLARNPLEFPKFSDNPDMPFWLAGHEESMASTAPPLHLYASASEPVLKVNEVPFMEEAAAMATPKGRSLAASVGVANRKLVRKTDMGSKTVKRFSREMMENGEGRNKPRLFDNIQPVEVNVRDFEPLDATSCMEPIRRKCLENMKSQNLKNAQRPMRSKMYDATRSQPGGNTVGRRASVGRVETPVTADPGVGGHSGLGPARDWHDGTNYPMRSKGAGQGGGQVQTVYVTGSIDALAPPKAFVGGPDATTGNGVRSGGFQHFDHTNTLSGLPIHSMGMPSKRAGLSPSLGVAPPPPALPL